MTEEELPPIHITEDDIQQANRLSLHCPICAGAVENYVTSQALVPVVCEACGTLYHKACWEQAGGKCAILGCDHQKYYLYGRRAEPQLTITHRDVAHDMHNGRNPISNKQYKNEQRRQVEALSRPGLWQRLWQWLLDQIKIG